MLASFLLLSIYIRSALRRWLILAAIFASLALLTRYVGFALVGAFFLVLILNRAVSWRLRLQELAIFLSITLVPTLSWLLRNWLVSNTLTNRAIVWHPISSENVAFLIKAVNSWGLLPQRLVVGHERVAFIAILIVLSSLGLFWLIRSLRTRENPPGITVIVQLSLHWFISRFLVLPGCHHKVGEPHPLAIIRIDFGFDHHRISLTLAT
jgi:4-amino-4-deoxy-L-arabinose transferase-like glycosyltransferase